MKWTSSQNESSSDEVVALALAVTLAVALAVVVLAHVAQPSGLNKKKRGGGRGGKTKGEKVWSVDD